MIKKAILWKKLEDNKVICNACARRCHIPNNSNGFCFVRKNINRELFLINYGNISAMQIDPIEKKPFNHFMPGSWVLGVGTDSCNFGCRFCQNHAISKYKDINQDYISPKELVKIAVDNKLNGIAFTYNEPTIFIEYAIDVAKIAHENGLFTVFVSNGYMTPEAVEMIKGNIDAVVIDFKGNGDKKFSNKYETVLSDEPIRETILNIIKAGIHLEITDLIIPYVGDSLEAGDNLTKWLVKNVGTDIPIQFTRFHPDYKMLDYPETSYGDLLKHYEIAKKNGMKFVYIGNVPGNTYENTYCPKCNKLVIERTGFFITKWNLDNDNRCIYCKSKIPLYGNYIKNNNRSHIEALI